MRQIIDMLNHFDIDMALLEIDPRYSTVVSCLAELRGCTVDPKRDTAETIARVRAISNLLATTLGELEAEHDLDSTTIRTCAMMDLLSRDN